MQSENDLNPQPLKVNIEAKYHCILHIVTLISSMYKFLKLQTYIIDKLKLEF